MNRLPKVAVCGGGAAGTAIAGDLALLGCQVNLFELEQFKNKFEPIINRCGIEITGETNAGKTGFAKLNIVTTNPEEAVKGVDLIMVAVPAFGHKAFFDAFSPYLEEGQSILVNTSYWACLRFAGKLRSMGIFDKITLAEASIMPYASEMVGPAATHIYRAKKKGIAIAAFPSTKTDRIIDITQAIYPQHEKVPNVLWTSLANLNTPLHAPLSIPVAGLMFDRYSNGSQGGCKFYGEATTSGARLVEAYDRERLAIAKKLGANIPSEAEALFRLYGYKKENIAEALRNSEHANMFVDIKFHMGLLEEDLRYFYVSLSQLGDSLEIATPITKAIITVMGTMLDIDYWQGATTLGDIGLSGLNRDQILKYVTEGKV